MTCYCNSTMTSCFCVVLLQQTIEVKALLIAHFTQFHNIRSAISQMVSHSRGLCSSTDHSIWHS